MCSIANIFEINIRKFDVKKYSFFPRMLRLCKSLGTLGWTLAENQKHQILGSQNYLILIKKV